MVDRGPRVLTARELAAGRVEFATHGNAWRFGRDHRIRIELAQDDEPFVKQSSAPSALSLTSLEAVIPVREQAKRRCGNLRTGDDFDNRHLFGGERGDRIRAGRGDDRVRGHDGPDCVNGGGGSDKVAGNAGRDRVTGGPGEDVLKGGRGRDRIAARDGRRDRVRCGKGRDFARVDRIDRVRGCERVKRA